MNQGKVLILLTLLRHEPHFQTHIVGHTTRLTQSTPASRNSSLPHSLTSPTSHTQAIKATLSAMAAAPPSSTHTTPAGSDANNVATSITSPQRLPLAIIITLIVTPLNLNQHPKYTAPTGTVESYLCTLKAHPASTAVYVAPSPQHMPNSTAEVAEHYCCILLVLIQ